MHSTISQHLSETHTGHSSGVVSASPLPEFIGIEELSGFSGLPVPVLLDLVNQGELILFQSDVMLEVPFIEFDSYLEFKARLRGAGKREVRHVAASSPEHLANYPAVPFSDQERAVLKKAGFDEEPQESLLSTGIIVESGKERGVQKIKSSVGRQSAEPIQAKRPDSAKQDKESQQSIEPYLKKVSENLCSYKQLDIKGVKALLAPFKKAFDNALEGNGQTPDYVEALGLPIVLVNKKDPAGGYRIDLRGKNPNRVKVKAKLGTTRVRLDATSLEKAIIEANALIHEKCQSEFPRLQARCNEYEVRDEPTLWDALLLSHRVNKSNLKKGKIKETEKRSKGYDDMIKCCGFWSYLVGELPLSMVDDEFVMECDVEFGMYDYSPSMIHKYFNELRKALKLAKKKGWIQSIPFIPSYPSGRREFIDVTPEKHELLKQGYSYAQHTGVANAEFRMAVEQTFLDILYYTGQRLSNARSIQLSEIDLQDGIWRIPANNSKAGKDFFLPLSDKAMEVIKTLLHLREEQGITCDYLLSFDNSGDLPQIDIQNWREAAQEAGFPAEFIRHHYRHNFITRLLSKGASIEDVKLVAGMASLGGLARYSHCKVTEVGKNIVNFIP